MTTATGSAAGSAADAGSLPAVAWVRIRLDLSYDGTDFAGWAAQRDQRTVQGELERAFATLARGAPLSRLTVAGRTDAGVHARGQVAHLDLPAELALDPLLLRRLNGLLPADVRVRRIGVAPEGFDARFCGVSRTYSYRIADVPEAVDPLRRHETLVWPRELDLVAIREAAEGLLGLRNFAAFCKRREGATTTRNLLRLECERQRTGVLLATVQADAFCHSMVRSLMGALIAVGEGRHPASWPGSLLLATVRASGVLVAPPHALTLEGVEYPPDDQLLARQLITRNLRLALPVTSVGTDQNRPV